jgi:hypothetical protein
MKWLESIGMHVDFLRNVCVLCICVTEYCGVHVCCLCICGAMKKGVVVNVKK